VVNPSHFELGDPTTKPPHQYQVLIKLNHTRSTGILNVPNESLKLHVPVKGSTGNLPGTDLPSN
jgi:hypothetical protein